MNHKSNIAIVDGDAVILIRALRNHTSLSYEQLKQMISRQLETDDYFDPVLDFVEKKKLGKRI